MVKKDSDKMAKKDKKPKHEREDLHEEDGSATNGTPSRVTLSAQSNPDLRSFIYEELETNSNELRQIWQIGECIRVYFKQIGNVHDHYRMQIIQQEEIKSLRALLEDSRTYKEDEMRRLEDENESYKGRFAGFEQAKERLEHEQKTMSRSKAQYEAEVKKVKDKEVHDAIEELVAKHESEKQRVANEHASKVHGLEKDIEKEKKRHSVMQAQVKLEKEQAKARVESLEIDNQSLRGNIKAKQVELECKDEELRNLKALKGLNPRGHQF